MGAPDGQPTSLGTEDRDYQHTWCPTSCGADEPYEWGSPHWRKFFTMVADRIRAVANPSSVLDVGCATGLLVQAFCEQGVDAYGIDVSQHAIETAHPNVSARLSVGSAEEIDGSWDLITCLEVLEHMAPAATEEAIQSMSAASDRVIVSFTPSNSSDTTHTSVQEPAAWAGSFAGRGLFRRTDVDLSFLAPWAALFERADVTKRDLVYRYELGAGDLKSRLDELQSRLDERTAANLDLRQQLLTTRDQAIGAEAEAAEWRHRCEDAVAPPDTAYSSTTRRMGEAIKRRIAKSAGRQR
jgi:SAM-dependent methyltransferase